MEIFNQFTEAYERKKVVEMSLQDYLLGCRDDPLMRATAAERMVAAIGEPELVDTSQDPRLGRIFLNRTIKRYEPFRNLYGIEETVGFEGIALGLRGRPVVELIKVDALQLQALQTRLEGRRDGGRDRAVLLELEAHLGADDDIGFQLREDAPEVLLGRAVAILRRRVEVGDAALQGICDGPLLVAGVSLGHQAADRPASEG